MTPLRTSVPKQDGRAITCMEYILSLFIQICRRYAMTDPSVVLLTWSSTSTEPLSPLTNIGCIPTSGVSLIPYLDSLWQPQLGKKDKDWVNFIFVRWGFLGNSKTLLLQGAHNAWFADGGHTCYPTAIQGSTREVSISYMRFSGIFTNTSRLLSTFHDSYPGRFPIDGNINNEFLIGCQVLNQTQAIGG
jgi:hypothetical protein